ncbi:MAG: putative holin [Desulfovibrionaceae bacterium]|nr:putative holin [Desulfovibrionaceae bacterium]
MFDRIIDTIKNTRMKAWLAAAFVLALLVWLLAPQQLPVSLYKLSLVAMAAVAGYWIDRSLFPYARPGEFLADEDDAQDAPPVTELEPAAPHECELCVAASDSQPLLLAAAMLRRAVIVAATMLAVGLGA